MSRRLAHRLGRVRVEQHATLPADRSDLVEGLQNPDLVVGGHHAHQQGLGLNRLAQCVELDPAVRARRQHGGMRSLPLQVADRVKHGRFIDEMSNPRERDIARAQLEQIVHYAEVAGCRRVFLLGYFGETFAGKCGNCDNCLTPPRVQDGKIIAQKLLSCVYRTGQRFGAMHLTGGGLATVIVIVVVARLFGVDVSGVARLPDVAPGVALIIVDPSGENQIAVAPLPEAAWFGADFIRPMPPRVRNSS